MMLGRSFFERDPLICARELIGCQLRWGQFSGLVVETEAYDTEGDEACHTAFRPSTRVFVESHNPGAAYVYFNYGVHWMLNVLVKGKRSGFVLIRALEPIDGLEVMKKARGTDDPRQLCSGPGKLTKALGITGVHHGRDLCTEANFSFWTAPSTPIVEVSLRVGISRAQGLPWRFHAAENLHVSRLPTKDVPGRKTIRPRPRETEIAKAPRRQKLYLSSI
ncbi:MAG TPA: DNA-3-methyladenine glycosylase [Terrimicrobiaceae bacterium]